MLPSTHTVKRVATTVAIGALLVGSVTGCINRFWRTDVRAVERPSDGQGFSIASPVKAHMADGSTVVFRGGALVDGTHLRGEGEHYPLLHAVPAATRAEVPLDSVVGLEAFEGKVLAAQSVAVSLAATALGAAASVALFKALFGSCPTVYSDTSLLAGAEPALEAEGFSYAIAPMFEQRDVDPLRARPDARGVVRLELRNEALETHFINHVEVLAARHAPGTVVVPDQGGHPVILGGTRALSRATDRAGRDVRGVLSVADGRLFSSDSSTLAAAHAGDLDDWIDVEADDVPPGDSVAVLLRLRNSLLNTVLLYEQLLGGRDAADWLANGLQHIGTAVDVSRWYVRTMGMRVSVEGDAGDVVAQTRLGDAGPLAFRDVAVVLPRAARDARRVRMRLRFVADNWRIDRVTVAGVVSRPRVEPLPIERVMVPRPASGSAPATDGAAVSAIADADGAYLETRPGQRMTLEFARDTAAASDEARTTYLIAWQGWYREWIRGHWLARPTRTAPFVPGDDVVVAALARWRGRQAAMEREFYATKIPVR